MSSLQHRTIFVVKIRLNASRNSVLKIEYMIGLKAEFEYPSHDNILNVWPPIHVLQKAATIFTQKNGTQQPRKTL
jgi:hypothetical protein